MNIKARMVCQQVLNLTSPEYTRDLADGTRQLVPAHKYAEQVSLAAVYSSDTSSPNYSFSQATPLADLRIQVNNPLAWGAFVEGGTYDLDIARVPDTQLVPAPTPTSQTAPLPQTIPTPG